MPQHDRFDYVIVGAGSAGCTLANRLTADAQTSVLLLEAGGWDRDPTIQIPLGWGRLLKNRLHDWMYFSEPEPNMFGRQIECARGKVIGGSSSINAMAYVRGHREGRRVAGQPASALAEKPEIFEELPRRRWPTTVVHKRHRHGLWALFASPRFAVVFPV